MKHLKLFEEISIEENEFPIHGHDLSTFGHKEIVELLLNDERVRSKLTEEQINKYTKYTNETS